MPAGDGDFLRHRMSWADFDGMARGGGGARVVRQLRRAERSRRLLLIRSLVDEVAKSPEPADPLPTPEDAWDLLARVEHSARAALDLVLSHPYTGSWVGYTTRLLTRRISGVWPAWVHTGYVHSLAAAAAIRAGIRFTATIPVWRGEAILPTLGLVRLPSSEPGSVAEVRGEPGCVEVRTESGTVVLPDDLSTDSPVWWSIRRLSARAGNRVFSVRLDDVDPYRGAYEPIGPQRLSDTEANAWQELMTDAWALITEGLPDFAEALRAGFDSVTPKPLALFRAPSSSSSEAFGSAIIGRPADAASLASTLVHEFQHSRLSGLMHITQLWQPDPRERFYAPWRDDPRPIGGIFQGVYAFFGMTSFWRAMAARGDRRGSFEFAYHRTITWRAVNAVRHDSALTETGRRLVDAIAGELGPWQQEPIAEDVVEAATRTAQDHYLGWRIRHLRPDPALARNLAEAWLRGNTSARYTLPADQPPTPVPDGNWTHARADMARMLMIKGPAGLQQAWQTVPDTTPADLALVAGRFPDAIRAYRAELARYPDRPSSLAGLALALSALDTSPATRALLHCPELVRAVHRLVRTRTTHPPSPEDLAHWIGQTVR